MLRMQRELNTVYVHDMLFEYEYLFKMNHTLLTQTNSLNSTSGKFNLI